MLRRTTFSRISSYEFGHPTMNSNFSKEVYPATKAQPWGPVQKTTLNNGMKVITQDRKGQQSSVGFFVEAGPKFDPISAPGLSYVMRWAALTSNASESLFQFDRAMRSVGASYESAEINKRYLGWISEVPRQAWKTPIENMQTCFAVPRFAESDIERFRDTMDNELEEMRWKTPREYCEHMMETVAFFKEPLGNPRHVLPTDNDVCSHSELLKQYCKYFTPQRFTLAGINVDHSELIAYYGSLQYQLTSNAPHFNNGILERSAAVDETEAKQWYGLREGCKPEKRTYAMGTHPHQEEDGTFAIGWLTNGADKSVREYATSLVARAVLDAQTGDSLRTNRSQVHFGARTFYKPYSSTGLIGVTFRGPVDSRLKDEYKKLLTTVLPKSVASPDVKSAAARAALSYFSNNLETQRDALKTLATSTFEGDAVIEEIGKVTVDDVNAAFVFMKKNKPVTYSTGMIHDLPPLRQLALEYNF